MLSVGLSPDYLHASLFVPIYQTAVGITSTVEIAKEASNFQYKLWENQDLTVQPIITYICVTHGMHSVYLPFQTVIL